MITTSFDRATSFYGRGENQAAAEVLREILANEPENADANLLLGVILSKTGQYGPAEVHLRSALRQEAGRQEALVWLAITLKCESKFDEAIEFAEQAVEVNPNAFAYNALGTCWLSNREPRKAAPAFTEAARLEPNSAPAFQNLGLALRLDEKWFEAAEAFRKAVELAPNNIENWLHLCEQFFTLGRLDDVVEAVQRGLQLFPNSVALVTTLANAYNAQRKTEEAERLYKRALEISPAATQAYARFLVEHGRQEEAFEALRQSIRLTPAQGYSYYYLAESRKFDLDGEPWLPKALSFYNDPALKPRDRMFLDYALGMAYDDQGDYEHAMGHFDHACEAAFRIYNAGRPFDAADIDRKVEEKVDLFNQPMIADLRVHGSSSKQPIFIVGMIRSGTTLLGQIVSSHPLVSAAGELDYWTTRGGSMMVKWATGVEAADIEPLAAEYLEVLGKAGGVAQHLTDKMPLNFNYLGLIHGAFPESKILHIRRDPLDTCLSVYMAHYGSGPKFAYRQENIVAYYRGYEKLMEHWGKVIPANRLLDVEYEDLVSDRETASKRILDFLELPWDDSVLHHEERERAIAGPGSRQDHQPVHSSSIGRWKRYEPWLGALLELKDKGKG